MMWVKKICKSYYLYAGLAAILLLYKIYSISPSLLPNIFDLFGQIVIAFMSYFLAKNVSKSELKKNEEKVKLELLHKQKVMLQQIRRELKFNENMLLATADVKHIQDVMLNIEDSVGVQYLCKLDVRRDLNNKLSKAYIALRVIKTYWHNVEFEEFQLNAREVAKYIESTLIDIDSEIENMSK